MISIMGWIATVLSIIGAILNAQKKTSGFYIWIIANILWVIYDLILQNYPQAVLFTVYAGISTYGIVVWLRKR